MKETFYFSHDYNARNDDKLLEVRSKFGNEGYALFWYCVETMAERGDGYLIASLMGGLSLGYGIPKEMLVSFLDFCVDTGIFMRDDKGVFSQRMVEHLKYRKTLSDKGKEGAEKRWKNREAIAPLMQRKGKESKEKENVPPTPTGEENVNKLTGRLTGNQAIELVEKTKNYRNICGREPTPEQKEEWKQRLLRGEHLPTGT